MPMLFLRCLCISRFLYASVRWGEDLTRTIDESLGEHIISAPQPQEEPSFIMHLDTSTTPTTMRDKISVLQSLPNYHWWQQDSGPKPNVRFSSHLLYCPTEKDNDDGRPIAEHPPTSPRNRVMYHLSEEYSLGQIVQQLIKRDMGEGPDGDSFAMEISDSPPPPPRKKRKHGARILKIPRPAFSQSHDVDLNSLLNVSSGKRKLFACFSEELVTGGVIQWRLHYEERDIVVLSDYDPTTGTMIPGSFVHVLSTKEYSGDGSSLIKCNCASYNLIQKAALYHCNLQTGERDFLEEDMTCMHCRFFKENLSDLWASLGQQGKGHSLLSEKATSSFAVMDKEVLVVGDVLPHGTTKFSVKGGDSFGFVHLTLRGTSFWAKCMEGICSAQAQNKSKHARVFSLRGGGKVCDHLTVISQNWEVLQQEVPELFFEDDDVDNDVDVDVDLPLGDAPNTEDRGLQCEGKAVFNNTTGLWSFPSTSEHQPLNMDDPHLVEYVFIVSLVA